MAWTTPATRTTGTLITAALWNTAVVGNIRHLGVTHDHSGDAGDGATLTLLGGITGMIGMFQTACPAGWTRVAAWDNKMLMGSATYGTTGGADSHEHTNAAGHTHTATHTHGVGTLSATVYPGTETSYSVATTAAAANHTHAMAGTSAGGTVSNKSVPLGIDVSGINTLPPYVGVVFCKKDA
jgi:hypothetical protein